MQRSDAVLDQQFQQIAAQLTILALSQPRAAKLRVQAWLTKLREPTSHIVWKRNRNMYCSLLLAQLQHGQLEAPFTAMPPDGSLPNLPNHLMYRGLSPCRAGNRVRSSSTSPVGPASHPHAPQTQAGTAPHQPHGHLGPGQLQSLVQTFHRDAVDGAADVDPLRKSEGMRHKLSASSKQPGSGAACCRGSRVATAAGDSATTHTQSGNRPVASSLGEDATKVAAACSGRGTQAQRDQQRASRETHADWATQGFGGDDSYADQDAAAAALLAAKEAEITARAAAKRRQQAEQPRRAEEDAAQRRHKQHMQQRNSTVKAHLDEVIARYSDARQQWASPHSATAHYAASSGRAGETAGAASPQAWSPHAASPTSQGLHEAHSSLSAAAKLHLLPADLSPVRAPAGAGRSKAPAASAGAADIDPLQPTLRLAPPRKAFNTPERLSRDKGRRVLRDSRAADPLRRSTSPGPGRPVVAPNGWDAARADMGASDDNAAVATLSTLATQGGTGRMATPIVGLLTSPRHLGLLRYVNPAASGSPHSGSPPSGRRRSRSRSSSPTASPSGRRMWPSPDPAVTYSVTRQMRASPQALHVLAKDALAQVATVVAPGDASSNPLGPLALSSPSSGRRRGSTPARFDFSGLITSLLPPPPAPALAAAGIPLLQQQLDRDPGPPARRPPGVASLQSSVLPGGHVHKAGGGGGGHPALRPFTLADRGPPEFESPGSSLRSSSPRAAWPPLDRPAAPPYGSASDGSNIVSSAASGSSSGTRPVSQPVAPLQLRLASPPASPRRLAAQAAVCAAPNTARPTPRRPSPLSGRGPPADAAAEDPPPEPQRNSRPARSAERMHRARPATGPAPSAGGAAGSRPASVPSSRRASVPPPRPISVPLSSRPASVPTSSSRFGLRPAAPARHRNSGSGLAPPAAPPEPGATSIGTAVAPALTADHGRSSRSSRAPSVTQQSSLRGFTTASNTSMPSSTQLTEMARRNLAASLPPTFASSYGSGRAAEQHGWGASADSGPSSGTGFGGGGGSGSLASALESGISGLQHVSGRGFGLVSLGAGGGSVGDGSRSTEPTRAALSTGARPTGTGESAAIAGAQPSGRSGNERSTDSSGMGGTGDGLPDLGVAFSRGTDAGLLSKSSDGFWGPGGGIGLSSRSPGHRSSTDGLTIGFSYIQAAAPSGMARSSHGLSSLDRFLGQVGRASGEATSSDGISGLGGGFGGLAGTSRSARGSDGFTELGRKAFGCATEASGLTRSSEGYHTEVGGGIDQAARSGGIGALAGFGRGPGTGPSTEAFGSGRSGLGSASTEMGVQRQGVGGGSEGRSVAAGGGEAGSYYGGIAGLHRSSDSPGSSLDLLPATKGCTRNLQAVQETPSLLRRSAAAQTSRRPSSTAEGRDRVAPTDAALPSGTAKAITAPIFGAAEQPPLSKAHMRPLGGTAQQARQPFESMTAAEAAGQAGQGTVPLVSRGSFAELSAAEAAGELALLDVEGVIRDFERSLQDHLELSLRPTPDRGQAPSTRGAAGDVSRHIPHPEQARAGVSAPSAASRLADRFALHSALADFRHAFDRLRRRLALHVSDPAVADALYGSSGSSSSSSGGGAGPHRYNSNPPHTHDRYDRLNSSSGQQLRPWRPGGAGRSSSVDSSLRHGAGRRTGGGTGTGSGSRNADAAERFSRVAAEAVAHYRDDVALLLSRVRAVLRSSLDGEARRRLRSSSGDGGTRAGGAGTAAWGRTDSSLLRRLEDLEVDEDAAALRELELRRRLVSEVLLALEESAHQLGLQLVTLAAAPISFPTPALSRLRAALHEHLEVDLAGGGELDSGDMGIIHGGGPSADRLAGRATHRDDAPADGGPFASSGAQGLRDVVDAMYPSDRGVSRSEGSGNGRDSGRNSVPNSAGATRGGVTPAAEPTTMTAATVSGSASGEPLSTVGATAASDSLGSEALRLQARLGSWQREEPAGWLGDMPTPEGAVEPGSPSGSGYQGHYYRHAGARDGGGLSHRAGPRGGDPSGGGVADDATPSHGETGASSQPSAVWPGRAGGGLPFTPSTDAVLHGSTTFQSYAPGEASVTASVHPPAHQLQQQSLLVRGSQVTFEPEPELLQEDTPSEVWHGGVAALRLRREAQSARAAAAAAREAAFVAAQEAAAAAGLRAAQSQALEAIVSAVQEAASVTVLEATAAAERQLAAQVTARGAAQADVLGAAVSAVREAAEATARQAAVAAEERRAAQAAAREAAQAAASLEAAQASARERMASEGREAAQVRALEEAFTAARETAQSIALELAAARGAAEVAAQEAAAAAAAAASEATLAAAREVVAEAERRAALAAEREDARASAREVALEAAREVAMLTAREIASESVRAADHLGGAVREVEDLRKQMVVALAAAVAEREAQTQAHEAEVRRLTDRIEQASLAAVADAAGLQQQSSDANRAVSALRSEVDRLRQQLEEARETVMEGSRETEQLRRKLEVAEEALLAAGQAQSELLGRLTAAEAEAEARGQLADASRRRLEDGTAHIARLQEHVKELRKRLVEAEEEAAAEAAAASDREVGALRQQLEEAQRASEAARGDAERLRRQLVEAQQAAEVAQSDAARLRQQLAEAQSAADTARRDAERLRQQLSEVHRAADTARYDAEGLRQRLTEAQSLAAANTAGTEQLRLQLAEVRRAAAAQEAAAAAAATASEAALAAARAAAADAEHRATVAAERESARTMETALATAREVARLTAREVAAESAREASVASTREAAQVSAFEAALSMAREVAAAAERQASQAAAWERAAAVDLREMAAAAAHQAAATAAAATEAAVTAIREAAAVATQGAAAAAEERRSAAAAAAMAAEAAASLAATRSALLDTSRVGAPFQHPEEEESGEPEAPYRRRSTASPARRQSRHAAKYDLTAASPVLAEAEMGAERLPPQPSAAAAPGSNRPDATRTAPQTPQQQQQQSVSYRAVVWELPPQARPAGNAAAAALQPSAPPVDSHGAGALPTGPPAQAAAAAAAAMPAARSITIQAPQGLNLGQDSAPAIAAAVAAATAAYEASYSSGRPVSPPDTSVSPRVPDPDDPYPTGGPQQFRDDEDSAADGRIPPPPQTRGPTRSSVASTDEGVRDPNLDRPTVRSLEFGRRRYSVAQSRASMERDEDDARSGVEEGSAGGRAGTRAAAAAAAAAGLDTSSSADLALENFRFRRQQLAASPPARARPVSTSTTPSHHAGIRERSSGSVSVSGPRAAFSFAPPSSGGAGGDPAAGLRASAVHAATATSLDEDARRDIQQFQLIKQRLGLVDNSPPPAAVPSPVASAEAEPDLVTRLPRTVPATPLSRTQPQLGQHTPHGGVGRSLSASYGSSSPTRGSERPLGHALSSSALQQSASTSAAGLRGRGGGSDARDRHAAASAELVLEPQELASRLRRLTERTTQLQQRVSRLTLPLGLM